MFKRAAVLIFALPVLASASITVDSTPEVLASCHFLELKTQQLASQQSLENCYQNLNDSSFMLGSAFTPIILHQYNDAKLYIQNALDLAQTAIASRCAQLNRIREVEIDIKQLQVDLDRLASE